MKQGRNAGVIAILITAVLWGTTGTAATFAPEVGPLAMGAAALGIGGALQGLIALPSMRRERDTLASHRKALIAGAAGVAIYPLAFYSSMHLAGVAVGTVISLGSAPIASGLLEWIIERRTVTKWWVMATGLGIGGSGILCAAKMHDAPSDFLSTAAGVGLGLIAGATYALYSWSAHHLMNNGVGRAAAMGSVFGLGGLTLIPVLIVTGSALLSSPQTFAVGAYMALIPMFLGYVLFGFGLTKVSASIATTLTLAEPAVATVLAVVIVGERLPALGWFGLAGIGISLLILGLAPTVRTSEAWCQATPPEHDEHVCNSTKNAHNRA